MAPSPPLHHRDERLPGQGGGPVGGQPASTKLSLAEIARQKKQQEADDFRRLVLQLEPLEDLPELPNECCRLIRDEKDHLTIENFKLQAKLGEALNQATGRESENWDLTDKVYELEGQVRTLTNANEDGERQRALLENELDHYKDIVSQLTTADSFDSLGPSDEMSSLDVHDRSPSAGLIEEESAQHLDNTRPTPSISPFLSHPVPAPTRRPSSNRLALGPQSSRSSLRIELFAEPDDCLGSVVVSGSPGPRAAFEASPMVLSDAVEPAKRDRARQERVRDVESAAISPKSARLPRAQSVSGYPSVDTTVTRHATSSRDIDWDEPVLPSPFVRRNTNAHGQMEGVAAGRVAPSDTPSGHLPAGVSASARRPPLGPSTFQPAVVAVVGPAQISPELMARIRAVLPKEDVKAFRKFVTQRDSCEPGSAKEADLLRRIRQIFLPAASSPSSVPSVKLTLPERVVRNEVLDGVVRFVRER